MSLKNVFTEATAALTRVSAIRVHLAALIANPTAKLDEIAAARQDVDQILDELSGHEEALRQTERVLVIANNETGLAERDAKLKDISVSRDRLAILLEELEKRRELAQRKADNDGARRWAAPKVAEFLALVAKIDDTPAVAEKLDELATIAIRARGLGLEISRKFEAFPEVPELDVRWPTTLMAPVAAIERLAILHTNLERPRGGAR